MPLTDQADRPAFERGKLMHASAQAGEDARRRSPIHAQAPAEDPVAAARQEPAQVPRDEVGGQERRDDEDNVPVAGRKLRRVRRRRVAERARPQLVHQPSIRRSGDGA